MSFFQRFFRRTPASNASSLPVSQHAQTMAGTQNGTRRELLRLVLRDTLMHHGIPLSWIVPEVLVTAGADRHAGLHMRLLVRHWDPRLPIYAVAIERELIDRLSSFEPMAHDWFQGFSWKYDLPDEHECPDLPDADTWQNPPSVLQTTFHDDPDTELQRLFAHDAATSSRRSAGVIDPSDPAQSYESTQTFFRPTEPAGLNEQKK